jgi:hypothetical protein
MKVILNYLSLPITSQFNIFGIRVLSF